MIFMLRVVMPEVQRETILSVCTPTLISPENIREEYRNIMTIAKVGPGIVQIAQGCLGQCTYCLTRFARGPLKSFSKEEILSQVQAFVRSGIPEIHLTAQDVSAWGRDCGGVHFPNCSLTSVIFRARFMVRVGDDESKYCELLS